MTQPRQYELVYIVAPDATEQDLGDLHAQIEGIVQRFDGTLDGTEQWGRRKLAYDIGRHREGIYVLETMTGGGEMVKEIDRRLKVVDQVIRHLVVRVDEDIRVAGRLKAAREAAAARRRAARGLPSDAPAATPVTDAHGTDTGNNQAEANHE